MTKSVEFLINNGNRTEWSLESDWFSTAHIYSLIVLLKLQNCPIGPVRLPGACNLTGQIGQLKSQCA